jgi:hypothetical protein
MKEQIEKVLTTSPPVTATAGFTSCKVTVDSAEEGAVKLAGRVLEASYLEAVRQSLPAGVRVRRVERHGACATASRPRTMTVANQPHRSSRGVVVPLRATDAGHQRRVARNTPKKKRSGPFDRQADGYLGWAYRPYPDRRAADDADARRHPRRSCRSSRRKRTRPEAAVAPARGHASKSRASSTTARL